MNTFPFFSISTSFLVVQIHFRFDYGRLFGAARRYCVASVKLTRYLLPFSLSLSLSLSLSPLNLRTFKPFKYCILKFDCAGRNSCCALKLILLSPFVHYIYLYNIYLLLLIIYNIGIVYNMIFTS